MYPGGTDEGKEVGMLRAELTRSSAHEYDLMVYRWPLSRLLIYMETIRVRRAFDELEEDAIDTLSASGHAW